MLACQRGRRSLNLCAVLQSCPAEAPVTGISSFASSLTSLSLSFFLFANPCPKFCSWRSSHTPTCPALVEAVPKVTTTTSRLLAFIVVVVFPLFFFLFFFFVRGHVSLFYEALTRFPQRPQFGLRLRRKEADPCGPEVFHGPRAAIS